MWQCCVCGAKSRVTRCTLLMVLYLCRMCQSGLHARSSRTSIYFCSSSLQNFAAPQGPLFTSVSMWNDLADTVLDGVGMTGFKSWANIFLLALAAVPFFVFDYFHFLFFLSIDWYSGPGFFRLIWWRSLLPALHCRPLLIIIIIIITTNCVFLTIVLFNLTYITGCSTSWWGCSSNGRVLA